MPKCFRTCCTNEAEGFKHIQLGGDYCRECVRFIDLAHPNYVLEHGSLFMPLKSLEMCMRDKDELFFVSHPEIWPHQVSGRKFIAMKRRGVDIFRSPMKDVESGLGCMIEGDGPTVFLGNIFMGQFDEDRSERFGSYEELIQKWQVD